MMRVKLFSLFLVLACTWTSPASAQFSMAEQFSASTITNKLGETMPVRTWKRYTEKDLPVPVVVLLHGSGECGRDNAKQLKPFQALYQQVLIGDKFPPAFYVIPQCTHMNGWVRSPAFSPDYRLPRYPAPALRTVKEYLDQLIEEGVADPDRIYLSGYSLGGFGTWDAIQRWPNYFAAAIPLCGGGSMQEEAIKAAATTSMWIFHGEADISVKVNCSRRMLSPLMQAGASPKYTEYPKMGHNIWNRVYGDSALLNWMFRQERGEQESAKTDSGGFFGQLKAYIMPD